MFQQLKADSCFSISNIIYTAWHKKCTKPNRKYCKSKVEKSPDWKVQAKYTMISHHETQPSHLTTTQFYNYISLLTTPNTLNSIHQDKIEELLYIYIETNHHSKTGILQIYISIHTEAPENLTKLQCILCQRLYKYMEQELRCWLQANWNTGNQYCITVFGRQPLHNCIARFLNIKCWNSFKWCNTA